MLVEAQVACRYHFCGFVVGSQFLSHLFFFKEVGIIEVQVSHIFLADEGAHAVVVVGHEVGACLVNGGSQ